MARTLDHVRACLEDFRSKNGREPSTVEDFRAISNSAKLMAVTEEAFDEEEIPIPTYFGVQEMEA